VAVQAHLARAGFPCPGPLTGPEQAGGLTVTAETLIPGGSQLPPEHGAAPFAALLACLIASAPDPAPVPAVDRVGPSRDTAVARPRRPRPRPQPHSRTRVGRRRRLPRPGAAGRI